MSSEKIPCPLSCRDGFHHSSGDGWDEWDECRCCNPEGDNDTGRTTQKRVDEFNAAEAAEAAELDAYLATLCMNCGYRKAERNPSGGCDHLYWPDYLTDEAKRANGIETTFPQPHRVSS